MSDEKRAWLAVITERFKKGYVNDDQPNAFPIGDLYPTAAADMQRLIEIASGSAQGALIELVQEAGEVRIYNWANHAPSEVGYEVDARLSLDPPGSRLKLCHSGRTLAEAVEECLLHVRHAKAARRGR